MDNFVILRSTQSANLKEIWTELQKKLNASFRFQLFEVLPNFSILNIKDVSNVYVLGTLLLTAEAG